MIVGIPNAGQVNALGTLNIRGERSVTCRGDFDRHPSLGPAAAGRAAGLRVLPPAARRAGARRRARRAYRHAIPTSTRCRCTASCSRSRTRSTPRTCARPAAATRATTSTSRRAITCWSSSCATRARSSSPRRSTPNTTAAPAIPAAANKPDKVLPSTLGYQRSTWAGNPSNPYDTTRSASLGSSSGSGVSVSANLVMASLGEETRASCRGPSNHNAVALILPHKAMLGFDGGAIGADIYCDRTGIHCRTIGDCAKVLDALKDPERGLLRSARSVHHRAALVGAEHALREPRARRRRARRAQGHAARRHPRVDGLSAGLEDRASRSSTRRRRRSRPSSAAISARRWWSRPIRCGRPIPDIETDEDRFPQGAGAAGAGVHAGPAVPAEGATARRCSRISPPRSCRPSSRRAKCSASGTMQPIDYCVELAEGRIAPPTNLDLATIQQQEMAMAFRFHISQYLTRRAADWKAQGLHRDADRLGRAQRALEVLGRRPARGVQELGGGRRSAQSARPAPGRQRAHHAARAAAPRRHDGDPGEQARRAGAAAHAVAAGADRRTPISTTSPATCAPESLSGPNAGLTEVLIPAGYVTTVYDPVFKLSAGRQALRLAGVRQADHDPGARACRSRWCSAPSPARRTCCCRSPRPTRRRRSAASRRRTFRRCSSASSPINVMRRACPGPSTPYLVMKVKTWMPGTRLGHDELGFSAVGRGLFPDTAGPPRGTSSPRRG